MKSSWPSFITWTSVLFTLGSCSDAAQNPPAADGSCNTLLASKDKHIVLLKRGLSDQDADSHFDWIKRLGSNSTVAARIEQDIRFDNFRSYAGEFSDHVIEQIKKRKEVGTTQPAPDLWKRAPSSHPASHPVANKSVT